MEEKKTMKKDPPVRHDACRLCCVMALFRPRFAASPDSEGYYVPTRAAKKPRRRY
jgi:hypothetical protein